MDKKISLVDICRARDTRIERLKELSKQTPGGLILFTLNIPGSVKDSPLYRNIFTQGIRALKTAFMRTDTAYNIEHLFEFATGSEAYFSVSSADLLRIKKITADIEENHPLGRIFDIDIFDLNLDQVKSGREMRKCFICERGAFECSRSRRHTPDEVVEKIKTTAENYFDSFFWNVSAAAARAMITEVLVTPKPGLVDRVNSGSHSDMDIFTFTDSSTALTRTFYRMAQLGGSYNGYILSDLLTTLRKIGLEGEKEMYRITGGVNTQKGLIFSIGILSAAAGYILCRSRDLFSAEFLCSNGGGIAADITKKDLEKKKGEESFFKTNGEKLYNKYGIKVNLVPILKLYE